MNSLQNFRQNYRAQSRQNFNNNTLHQKQKKIKQTQNKVVNKRCYKKSYESKSGNEMTIDCGEIAATYQVRSSHGISILFCSNGHAVTRGYIKLDFTPAWELNKKVIDFIFFSTAKSKQGNAHGVDEAKTDAFRVAPKYMIYARAYFRGQVLAEVSDVGFSNIEEVISRLVPQLPATIPDRCAVQFRIRNVDTDREAVYERTKGKGF